MPERIHAGGRLVVRYFSVSAVLGARRRKPHASIIPWPLQRRVMAPSLSVGIPLPAVSAQPSSAKIILAGALAGAGEALVTYPLEFIKTQLQVSAASPCAPRTSLGVVRSAVAAHGLRGLYRGLAPYVAFSLPRSGLRFLVYEGAVSIMSDGAQGPSSAAIFLAGAVAGFVEAAAVIVPMTTLQVRLVSDRLSPDPRYTGMVDAVRQIWAREGARGFYRAAGPTLLKITCNLSLRFLLFDALSAELSRATPLRGSALSLVAGGLAGALSVAVNHPVDVVKSCLQGEQAAAYGGSGLRCARILYAAGGARALYVGLAPRMHRVVLETALSFTFYRSALEALPLR